MTRTIVVFGETGVGKSSLINMLVGRNVADTSDSATGCTFEARQYSDNNGNILYDTVGLNEAKNGSMSAGEAKSKLENLLRSLDEGINLLIFVIRKGRINEAMQENYNLFVNRICQGKVPVILAISGCELDSDPNEWYNQNQIHFRRNGMTFDRVVSGCFVQNMKGMHFAFQEELKYAFILTKEKFFKILNSGRYETSYKIHTPEEEIIEFLKILSRFTPIGILAAIFKWW